MLRFNGEYIRTVLLNGRFYGKIPYKNDESDFNIGTPFEYSMVPVGFLGYQGVITDADELKNFVFGLSGNPVIDKSSMPANVKSALPFGSNLPNNRATLVSTVNGSFEICRLTDSFWFKVQYTTYSTFSRARIYFLDPTRSPETQLKFWIEMTKTVIKFYRQKTDNTSEVLETVNLSTQVHSSCNINDIYYVYFKMDDGNKINRNRCYFGLKGRNSSAGDFEFIFTGIVEGAGYEIYNYRSPYYIKCFIDGGSESFHHMFYIWNYSKFDHLATRIQEAKVVQGHVVTPM